MKQKTFLLFLFLISCLYLVLRLNNLPNLLGFRLDQGIHLLETKTMFDTKKISLIGPMVTSKTFDGRNFFIGANYYYVLGIFGIIGKWNPLTITVLFILLELIFYLFFTTFLKRKFNPFLVLFTFLLITVSPYLVVHSRFFWNPHLLIPLSILSLFLLDKYQSQKKSNFLFIASFFWGFAFACHYTAIFWGLFFLYFLKKAGHLLNIKSYFLIIFGFILGDLPFIVFEIRHGFYNLKTLIYIFTHSVSGSDLSSSYYFVFSLLIFGLYFLLLISSKTKKQILPILVLTFLFISQFIFIKNYLPIDSISGWNYPEQIKIADLITKNGCPQNYNIAATMQGDTRFYDLRYLLHLKKCPPLSVESYPQSETLFLVAPFNRSPESESVWEVSSFRPSKISKSIPLNDKLIFYQLDKNAR